MLPPVLILAALLISGCAPEERKPDPPKPKSLSSAEHLVAAKDILTKKKPLNAADIGRIETHLRAISTNDPEHKEVPSLLKKTAIEEKRIIKEIAAKLRTEGIAARQLYVEELEREYLSKGFDVHLTASGPEKTIFTFKFILVSRPLVYQLSNSSSFMESLRKHGFKKAVFTDGHSGDWIVQVN